MHKKTRKTHWRSAYFKRINSTEVTIRRSKTENTQEKKSDKEIDTVPIFPKAEIEVKLEIRDPRTPDRVVNTPIRKIVYISPEKNIHIPSTPHSHSFESLGQVRSCKRLFW